MTTTTYDREMSGQPQGWYPDPLSPKVMQRYWDGAQWTTDVHPSPDAPESVRRSVIEYPDEEIQPLEAPPAAGPRVRACTDCEGVMSLVAPACVHCGRPNELHPANAGQVITTADHATKPHPLAGGTVAPDSVPESWLSPADRPASAASSVGASTNPPAPTPPVPPGFVLAPDPNVGQASGTTYPPASWQDRAVPQQPVMAQPGVAAQPPVAQQPAAVQQPVVAQQAASVQSGNSAPAKAGKGRRAARPGNVSALITLILGGIALLLGLLAYQGAGLTVLVFALVAFIATLVAARRAKKAAEKANVKRSWMVLVGKLLAWGGVILLGFGIAHIVMTGISSGTWPIVI